MSYLNHDFNDFMLDLNSLGHKFMALQLGIDLGFLQSLTYPCDVTLFNGCHFKDQIVD